MNLITQDRENTYNFTQTEILLTNVPCEAMVLVMDYIYGREIFKCDISHELLEEVLILANYFDLPGLLDLATDKIIHMIDHPRLRDFNRRRVQEMQRWEKFTLENQIYRVHSQLLPAFVFCRMFMEWNHNGY